MGLLAAVLALRSTKFDTYSYIALSVSIVGYLVVSWNAWRGYRANTWKFGPDLAELWSYASESKLTDNQLDWFIGNHIRLDYDENGPAVAAKSHALDIIAPALLTQTLTLVLTLVAVAVAA